VYTIADKYIDSIPLNIDLMEINELPTILANILKQHVGSNTFSDAIDKGQDIYEFLQQQVGLKSRGEGKDLFFKISFGKPDNRLLNYLAMSHLLTGLIILSRVIYQIIHISTNNIR